MLGDFNLPNVDWYLVAQWQPHIISDLLNQIIYFRPGYSCTSQLIHLFHEWAKALDKRLSTTDVIFLDFERAFDSVPHDRLLLKLECFGITGSLLSWLSNLFLGRSRRVVIEGCQSDWAPVIFSVPQGNTLPPLLFILYVNDVPEFLSSPADMFADDMLIYNYCPPSETSITAQESLYKVTDWCGSWLLRTNTVKCESMKFTRSRTPSPCNYTINSKLLTQVSTHKHLGVVLSSDLSWKPHVLSVVARSNRLLGLLKRTFGSRSKALFTGYKAMIRPILEYACQAWNPHQAHLIEKLECVQRNVTRWIVGKDIPYEDRLKSLKLPTLVQRREYLSLVQLFKFIKGHSSVNTNDYISFSNRLSRKSNQFKLYKPFCRTDTLKYSFWHRYIDTWNSLQSSVVELDSMNTFKKAPK